MKLEAKLSWSSLKNIADALDSYRVRALIDAKKEIIDAGIYNEDQYYEILFKIIDDEKLKYALYEFIKKKKEAHLE
jgi:hypothetical protein